LNALHQKLPSVKLWRFNLFPFEYVHFYYRLWLNNTRIPWEISFNLCYLPPPHTPLGPFSVRFDLPGWRYKSMLLKMFCSNARPSAKKIVSYDITYFYPRVLNAIPFRSHRFRTIVRSRVIYFFYFYISQFTFHHRDVEVCSV